MTHNKAGKGCLMSAHSTLWDLGSIPLGSAVISGAVPGAFFHHCSFLPHAHLWQLFAQGLGSLQWLFTVAFGCSLLGVSPWVWCSWAQLVHELLGAGFWLAVWSQGMPYFMYVLFYWLFHRCLLLHLAYLSCVPNAEASPALRLETLWFLLLTRASQSCNLSWQPYGRGLTHWAVLWRYHPFQTPQPFCPLHLLSPWLPLLLPWPDDYDSEDKPGDSATLRASRHLHLPTISMADSLASIPCLSHQVLQLRLQSTWLILKTPVWSYAFTKTSMFLSKSFWPQNKENWLITISKTPHSPRSMTLSLQFTSPL